jgi:transglycosylase-like protein with SLT domain
MKGWVRFVAVVLWAVEPLAVARAGERAAPMASVNTATTPAQRAVNDDRASARAALDRVAYAVDGAESSHGADLGMWGPDPAGPQGPMQVTEAAATDVGGGDRFDLTQNRAIGRDYLALLFRRYKNWPDAIAAYNWGMGNVDAWVKAGRPADKFLIGVAAYLRRVLRDSGMCDREAAVAIRRPTHPSAEEGERESVAFAVKACPDLDAWGGLFLETGRHSLAHERFRSQLAKASQLAAHHFPPSQYRDPQPRGSVRLPSDPRVAVAMYRQLALRDASPWRLRGSDGTSENRAGLLRQ